MKERGKVPFTKGGPVYPRVIKAIEKLGADISLARRARGISAEDFAASMAVSRATLYRLEHGDAGVSLNTLAMALKALGRLDALADLADETKDDITLMMMRRKVPKRVPTRRTKARKHAADGVTEDEPMFW